MSTEPHRRQHLHPGSLPQVVVHKWSEAVLAEGFVPFPKRLLRSLQAVWGASSILEELAVVLAVADSRRPNWGREPSRSFLAFLAGLDQPVFDAGLQRLADRGLATAEDTEIGVVVDLGPLLRKVEEATPDSGR